MANLLTYGGNMSSLAQGARDKNAAYDEASKLANRSSSGRTISMLQNNKSIEKVQDEDGVNRLQVTGDFYKNMDNWDPDTTDNIFGESLKRYMSKDAQGNVIYKKNQKIGNPIEATAGKDGKYPVPGVVLAQLEDDPTNPTLLGLKQEYENGDRKVLAFPTLTKDKKIKFLTRFRTDDPSDAVNYVDKESFAAFAQARLNVLYESSSPEAFSENANAGYVNRALSQGKAQADVLPDYTKQMTDMASDDNISPAQQAQGISVPAYKAGSQLSSDVTKGFHSEASTTTEQPAPETELPADITTEPAVDTGPDNLPVNWMNSQTRKDLLQRNSDIPKELETIQTQMDQLLKDNPQTIGQGSNMTGAMAAGTMQITSLETRFTNPEDKETYNGLEDAKKTLLQERMQANAQITKLDKLATEDLRTDSMGQPIISKETVLDIDTSSPNSTILTKRNITTREQITTGLNDGSLAEIVLEDDEVVAIQQELQEKGVRSTDEAAKKIATGEIKNPQIVAMGLVNALTGADGLIYGMDRKEALNYFYNGLTEGLYSATDTSTVNKNNFDIANKAITNRQNNRTADQTDRQLDQVDRRLEIDEAFKNQELKYKFSTLSIKNQEFMKTIVDERKDDYEKVNELYTDASKYVRNNRDPEFDGDKTDYNNFIFAYEGLEDAIYTASRNNGGYAKANNYYNDYMSNMVVASKGEAGIFKFDKTTNLMLSDRSDPAHNTMLKNREDIAYQEAYNTFYQGGDNRWFGLDIKEYWGDVFRPNDPSFEPQKFLKERIAVRTGKDGKPSAVVIFKLGPGGVIIETESSVPYGSLKNKINAASLKIILNNAPIIGDTAVGKDVNWLASQPSLINNLQAMTNSAAPKG